MKRLTVLILSALMLLSLCACDGGGETDTDAYVFKKGSVSIEVDADLASIVAALGEPTEYDEKPSCGHTGTSLFYSYAGFEIESYPKGNKDLVFRVTLFDDSVSTAEGIRVGDSRENVIDAYGEPTKDSATSLLFEAKNMSLKIVMTDGGQTVSQIHYLHPEALNSGS